MRSGRHRIAPGIRESERGPVRCPRYLPGVSTRSSPPLNTNQMK